MHPCPCRGLEGLAHLNCLVHHAEFSQRDEEVKGGFMRWSHCESCNGKYEGSVGLAMAWCWWRTDLARNADEFKRISVMYLLANTLFLSQQENEAMRILRQNISLCHHYLEKNPGDVRFQDRCRHSQISLAGSISVSPLASRADLVEARAILDNEIMTPALGENKPEIREVFNIVKRRLAQSRHL